nr:transposase [Wenjunlia tyrosinilytica]
MRQYLIELGPQRIGGEIAWQTRGHIPGPHQHPPTEHSLTYRPPRSTENRQIGVFAAYASSKGRALVDRELYLPKSWTSDSGRCRAAKIPDERGFATKGELAKAMVVRALSSPPPNAWVTADSAYAQEWRFRRMLEEADVGYVLAVPKSQHVHGLGRIDFAITQGPRGGMGAPHLRRGGQGPARLRLGGRPIAGHRRLRRRPAHPRAVGPGPPQPGPPGRDRLLSRLRTGRNRRR